MRRYAMADSPRMNRPKTLPDFDLELTRFWLILKG